MVQFVKLYPGKEVILSVLWIAAVLEIKPKSSSLMEADILLLCGSMEFKFLILVNFCYFQTFVCVS